MNKQEARQFFLAKRRQADPALLELWSDQIAKHILDYAVKNSPSVVLAYAAFRREPKTDGIIRRLLQQGVCVGLPKCHEGGQMEAYVVTDFNNLVTGRFGILEPLSEQRLQPEEIDLVLVPGCGFGRDMSRIGYGGGYYDRYLPRCHRAALAGVSYACCVTDSVPSAACDVKMDFLITEHGVMNKL